jgi:hypothetical protein
MGSRGVLLAGAVAVISLAACGGSSHKTTTAATSSVVTTAPATASAPKPAITRRLLTPSEMPTGFTAQGDPSVSPNVAEFLQQVQTAPAQLKGETARLKRIGFVTAASQNLNSAQGAGISVVEQFRSPAGAGSEFRNSVATFTAGPGQVKFPVSGIPHAAGFGGTGPNAGVNVAFADGDYYYLVGEQPNAPANRAAVIRSAQKLYHRVHG